MSQYYSGKRSKNLYEPGSDKPFKLSRSKLESFISCPRCFYIDRRLGVGTPPGFPFNLNSAVDHLLKQEFDIHRANSSKHPLIDRYGVDAIPAAHPDLDKWRTNFTVIQFHHKATNLILSGAIDDLWKNSAGEYIVVDYKATSKEAKIFKSTLRGLYYVKKKEQVLRQETKAASSARLSWRRWQFTDYLQKTRD